MRGLARRWMLLGLLVAAGCGGCDKELVCPAGTVLIPPGTFTMGDNSSDDWRAGKPEHQVTLTKAYCIDRTEVTQKAGWECRLAGKCPFIRESSKATVEQHPDYPLDYVYWHQAKTYCEANGGRLPTEAEWEYAARGTDGRQYPWGNEVLTHEHAQYMVRGAEGPRAVGTHPKGRSPFGLEDMVGNVGEWVADPCGEYSAEPQTDPTAPAKPSSTNEPCRLKRGSNWGSTTHEVFLRWDVHPNTGNDQTGFRCVYPPKER